MNSLVKTFYFRRTNHGGGVRAGRKKSWLIPIVQWLKSWLVFLRRVSESSICEYLAVHAMPKVFRTQMILEGDNNQDDDVYK